MRATKESCFKRPKGYFEPERLTQDITKCFFARNNRVKNALNCVFPTVSYGTRIFTWTVIPLQVVLTTQKSWCSEHQGLKQTVMNFSAGSWEVATAFTSDLQMLVLSIKSIRLKEAFRETIYRLTGFAAVRYRLNRFLEQIHDVYIPTILVSLTRCYHSLWVSIY